MKRLLAISLLLITPALGQDVRPILRGDYALEGSLDGATPTENPALVAKDTTLNPVATVSASHLSPQSDSATRIAKAVPKETITMPTNTQDSSCRLNSFQSRFRIKATIKGKLKPPISMNIIIHNWIPTPKDVMLVFSVPKPPVATVVMP